MNIDKERELFERWGNDNHFDLDRTTNGYDDYKFNEIEAAWVSWQARAALLPSVEEIQKVIIECPVHRDCYLTAAQAVRDLLEAK